MPKCIKCGKEAGDGRFCISCGSARYIQNEANGTASAPDLPPPVPKQNPERETRENIAETPRVSSPPAAGRKTCMAHIAMGATATLAAIAILAGLALHFGMVSVNVGKGVHETQAAGLTSEEEPKQEAEKKKAKPQFKGEIFKFEDGDFIMLSGKELDECKEASMDVEMDGTESMEFHIGIDFPFRGMIAVYATNGEYGYNFLTFPDDIHSFFFSDDGDVIVASGDIDGVKYEHYPYLQLTATDLDSDGIKEVVVAARDCTHTILEARIYRFIGGHSENQFEYVGTLEGQEAITLYKDGDMVALIGSFGGGRVYKLDAGRIYKRNEETGALELLK